MDLAKQGLEFILLSYRETKINGTFHNGSPIHKTFKEMQQGFVSSEIVGARPIKVTWSVGMGAWARIPWMAFLDRRHTETTRRGVYPALLFCEDMSGLYIALIQGVEDLNNRMRKAEARDAYKSKARSLRNQIAKLSEQNFHLDDGIDLRTSSDRGKDYECSAIAYKHYPKGLVPADGLIHEDLIMLLNACDELCT